MPIIGFNFTKMLVETNEGVKGKININTNVTITSLEKIPLHLGKEDQDALKFGFEFVAAYEPKAGKINLKGNVIYLTAKDKTKEIIDEWKKNNKVDKELMALVLNNVLSKCNVQSIILSKEMNLPPYCADA